MRFRVSLGLLLLAGLGIALYFRPWSRVSASKEGVEAPVEVRTRSQRSGHESEARENRLEESARGSLRGDWKDLIDWIDGDPAPDANEVRQRLMETRVRWSEMDLQILAGGIGEMLASGMDGRTGMRFQVGAHGHLKSWPTMRVFLLDVLATSDPEMAAGIARGILDGTESADEYAVALRSLTREGPARASDGELLTRFQKMLDRREWLSSAGFAEAFDLPRTVGTVEAARLLGAWEGDPSLRRMALEEFAAERPGVVLAALGEGIPMDGRTRASLMARADPADASQLAMVDTYLKDAGVSDEEAGMFLKVFPLRSATTGFRLYGGSPRPYTKSAIESGDRAALAWVEKRLSEPGFEGKREGLLELRERLQEWTSQDR